jgi:hypothetical protein
MAPSEFDLRAALAEGEGDNLDADELISAGQARRVQRRHRLLTTAAVVALVAGGAVGVSQLDGGGAASDGSAAGDSAAGPDVVRRQADSGSATSGFQYGPSDGLAVGAVGSGHVATPPSVARTRLAQIGCPAATVADSLVQNGTKSTAAQARAPLFSAAVSSAVVCAYGSTLQPAAAQPRHPARLELIGSAAVRMAVSMERAGQSPNPGPCGQGVPNRFAVIGVGGSGNRLNTVTVQLVGAACAPVISNGMAVRYDWVPPPDLARRLSALTPTGVPQSPDASPTS